MEDRDWYHYALCNGMELNWFYDEYESDEDTARSVDLICADCPVRIMCLSEGVENKETGVWGGVYLERGKVDDSKNSHKQPEDWEVIAVGLRRRT